MSWQARLGVSPGIKPPSFDPLSIAWLVAWWADDPGGSYAQDDDVVPDNLGTEAATFHPGGSFDFPTFETNFDGTGKPAFDFQGDAVVACLDTGGSYNVSTVVTVGQLLGTDGADFHDGGERHLLDTGGGEWRMFAGGAVATGGTTDNDPHLFIAEFDGTNGTLIIDGSTIFGPTGIGGDNLEEHYMGASPDNSDHASSDGCQIAFQASIGRLLTAQEKSDLLGWAQAVYGV